MGLVHESKRTQPHEIPAELDDQYYGLEKGEGQMKCWVLSVEC